MENEETDKLNFKDEKKEEKTESKFQQAIDSHQKVGIDTYTLTTESGLQCIIKKPSIMTTAKLMPLMIDMGNGSADFGKAAILLIEECWIAGDEEIRKSDELKIEVGLSAFELVEMAKATLKKN